MLEHLIGRGTVENAREGILNGASPSEVLQHLAALGQRLGDVITTIRAGWES